MCGICGYLAAERGPLAPEAQARALRTVDGMARALAHRGPDNQGILPLGPAILGHRRLSIIDLSPEGNQPMANEDRTIWAVVNGEIYNFQALREQLQARGHRFRSGSDSEIVVHLYEDKGDDLVHELRGMYAFALWDGPRQRLLLVRDRLGKKPLYYARPGGSFLFASEVPALVQALPEPPAPNLHAIDRYLTLQYVPSPMSAFTGIEKLPPGHLLTVEPGAAPLVRRYWKPRFGPRPDAPATMDQALDELRPLLAESVKLRQIADVPLGAFLSGGVDSSLIVALMAQGSSRPVETFSIDFPGGTGEGRWARLVAERWRTNHHELVFQPDMVTILPELVQRYGEPFADTSAVPVYYLSKLTREHVVVALSGDGGDEVFGGYRRYLWDKLARVLSDMGPLGALVRAGLAHLPGVSRAGIRDFARDAGREMAARYLPLVAHFAPRDKDALMGPALRAAVGRVPGAEDPVVTWFAQVLASSDARDDVNRLLDLDTQTYLPEDILVKVDIASMAHALEVRAPLLDNVLVDWMAGLPGHLKLRGVRGKRLLRRVAQGLVPDAILTRKKKGFSLPVDGWFRDELKDMAHDLLTDEVTRTRGILDPIAVRRLLTDHAAGMNHGERLWNLLVLETWFRQTGKRS